MAIVVPLSLPCVSVFPTPLVSNVPNFCVCVLLTWTKPTNKPGNNQLITAYLLRLSCHSMTDCYFSLSGTSAQAKILYL